MNAILNFKNILTGSLILAAGAASAQNQIQSTQTDEKFGNTTVIYTKDKSANDAAILAQLDNSYGIGDVVRITVAEPKQAAPDMVASTDNAMMFVNDRPSHLPAQKVVVETPKPVQTVKKAEPAVAMQKISAPVDKKASKVLRTGSVYRLEKVYFDANQTVLKAESEEELDNLLVFMQEHPTAVIEVRGHTNNLMWPNADFANQLSTERAKAVADWLIAKGIPAAQIQYKGYGWTMPILPNINAEGRKKNQRVEVKILNM